MKFAIIWATTAFKNSFKRKSLCLFSVDFPQGLCIFVAGLIHYFYLVAFAWMLFEGVYLYLMVVQVFNTEIKMRLFYAVAWGKYRTDLNWMKYCYGSIENRNNRQVMSYVTRASAIEDRMLWNLAFFLLFVCS